MTATAECDHNYIITYSWNGKYHLWKCCVRCPDQTKLPESYWTRRAMEIESHKLRTDLAVEQNQRLHGQEVVFIDDYEDTGEV